jgi:DNA-binding NarL/FixJ family response regulator
MNQRVTQDQILRCLAAGMSNKEMVDSLGLSRSGINWRITQLYRRFGLYSAQDGRRLVIKAVKYATKNYAAARDSAAMRISGSAKRRAAKPAVGVRRTTPVRAAPAVVFAES